MQITGLVKRIIPFVLTFSVGLLLASLFIPIGLPDFGTWRENRRSARHCQEHRQLQMENDRLRMENEQLRRNAADASESWEPNELPPFDVDAPPPPPPPRRPHARGTGYGTGAGSGSGSGYSER